MAFVLSILIPNRSARTSADILECLSVEEYVFLVGISYSASLNIVVLAIVIGIVAKQLLFKSWFLYLVQIRICRY